MDSLEKYIVVLTDNGGNQYGVLSIYSGWNSKYIDSLITEFLTMNSKNEEEFLEKFSENVADMVYELNKLVSEKFENGRVEFEYDNCSMFNVDKIF